MSQSAVEAAINELTQAGVVTPDALKGCTPEEIGQIKTRFHLQLPAIQHVDQAILLFGSWDRGKRPRRTTEVA
jgi:hypothetical protein